MTRPLLRARLRRRIAREYSDGMCYSDACGSVLGSDAIADEVLRRIDGAKGVGDGTLWDLLLAIDWVKLLEVILSVVALFQSEEHAAHPEWHQGSVGHLPEWEERPIDRKADKEEAEAKRLADIDGETA